MIAIVVQPGVEFGDREVAIYNHAQALPLIGWLEGIDRLVFEAHSTDYQPGSALKALVDDHFAILKVGPALTFAYREAIFALAMIERELFAPNDPLLSPVRQALEASMLTNPSHWAPYYHGDETVKSLARRFSLSDRSRYYWPDPEVQSAIKLLIRNLASRDLPLGLLSKFFPGQFESILNRQLPADPVSLILARVKQVLEHYSWACS